jgi:hypothetical protein
MACFQGLPTPSYVVGLDSAPDSAGPPSQLVCYDWGRWKEA